MAGKSANKRYVCERCLGWNLKSIHMRTGGIQSFFFKEMNMMLILVIMLS